MREPACMMTVIGVLLAGASACTKQEALAVKAKEKEAMKPECEKGILVVETTVGSIGPYRVGVGNILERDGADGVVEAMVTVWRADAPPDTPPLFNGVVVAGDRFQVEGKTMTVTRIERLPAHSSEPGSARSYVCIAEE